MKKILLLSVIYLLLACTNTNISQKSPINFEIMNREEIMSYILNKDKLSLEVGFLDDEQLNKIQQKDLSFFNDKKIIIIYNCNFLNKSSTRNQNSVRKIIINKQRKIKEAYIYNTNQDLVAVFTEATYFPQGSMKDYIEKSKKILLISVDSFFYIKGLEDGYLFLDSNVLKFVENSEYKKIFPYDDFIKKYNSPN